MAGAELLRRVFITCGFCLEKWNKSCVKGAITSHRIVKEELDDELGIKKAIIQCTRCGHKTEHFPSYKNRSRSQIKQWKIKHEAAKIAKRELKKTARQERIKGAGPNGQ